MTQQWPPGSPRVLVTDAWLANAGDGAIATATGRLIERLTPGAAVLHAAYQWDLLGDRYPDLALVPPLASLLGMTGAASFSGWDAASGGRLVGGADLVVSQGGGFLLEHYQPWERLFALAAVADRGLPIVILGQTIGAFRLARARALLRRVLGAARSVVVRDQPSFLHALDLGADPDRLVLASDLTLTLFEAPESTVKHSPVPDGIAVVLSSHEQSSDGGGRREALAATVLQEVLDRTGSERVTLLSTSQGLGHLGFEDDARIAGASLDRLTAQQRSRTELVDGYVAPREAVEILGSKRAVVTQRLHPALFALAQGVPAALLLAAEKAGVLAGTALGDLVCVRPDDAEARTSAIDAALDPSARRGRELHEALAPATRRAELNVAALRDVLSSLSSPGRPGSAPQ